MPEIRPLEKYDLTAVVRLLQTRIENWPGDEVFLEQTALDHPWADDRFPSLVAVDEDGALAGFVGSQVRRLTFRGEPVTGVVCSHLVVAENAGASGALLLTRLMRGDQAITWSDSANGPVVRLWRAFGGQLDHSRASDWMLVLSPARWFGSAVKAGVRRTGLGRALLPVGAIPVQTIVGRRGRLAAPEIDPRISSTDASPEEIVTALPEPARKWDLAVNHDADHLRRVFTSVQRSLGPVTCRLVRRDDRVIGWYAYLPNTAEHARALHISAGQKDIDAVFADLVAHATASGCSVLAGRAEPHLDVPLSRWMTVLGHARRPVIHSADPALLAAATSERSLLSQLDSEWFAH